MIIKDPKTLNMVQDHIFADKAYWPDDDGTTFCNVATQDLLRQLGYGGFSSMSADMMYTKVQTSPEWLIKPIADAIELVQEGTIILGILPSTILGQSHGHVNTLTPGSPDFSGKWNCKTPLCMNLGRAGTCFRLKGENWAFQIMPSFYALVATL